MKLWKVNKNIEENAHEKGAHSVENRSITTF